ncbi:unnamed protein product [Cuscuta epithymum]|uniref:Uncharacterized protein n=1 Tax=Cuscuta epithymum TaxID=186058 RepID=A0AAV0GHK0_9ASTE|nr:unnamed protein product [Cuscuta epithymum]
MKVVSFIIVINIFLVHGLALDDGKKKNMKMSYGGDEEAAAAEGLNPLNYEESLRAGGVRLPSPMPNPSRHQIPFPPPPPSPPPRVTAESHVLFQMNGIL